MRWKEIREIYKLTQNDLAKKAGVSQSAIHYIENNDKSPTYETMKKMADGFGISVVKLVKMLNSETKQDKESTTKDAI